MSLMKSLLATFSLSFLVLSSFAQAPDVKSQVESHLRAAQKYVQEKRPDLAIPEFEKIVALDPSQTDAQANLGVLLYFRSSYKEAVPHLRAAVSAKPDLWKIQALLGLAEARLNDRDASRNDLEAAFPHLQGEKIQNEVGRALIDNYSSSGDLEKAAATASSLLSANPTDLSLLHLAYRLYSDLAGKAMLTMALTAPETAEMHEVMARELARHGDDDAAISNYRKALALNPHLPNLHYELADLLNSSSDEKLRSEAETELKAALADNPYDARAYLMLGNIASRQGNLKAAYDAESRAYELAPNDSDVCTALAKLLAERNQNDRARELFERAVQLDPTNYTAHYRLSGLYRQEGKLDEAKQQAALYLKYKQTKTQLEKVFHDMRVLSTRHTEEEDLPKDSAGK